MVHSERCHIPIEWGSESLYTDIGKHLSELALTATPILNSLGLEKRILVSQEHLAFDVQFEVLT